MMRITPEGKMEPWATGMRSPAGLGMVDGELFYTDNQGDWIGSGGIWHVKKGAFTGHPAGLRWSGADNSPVDMTVEQLYALVDPRQEKNESSRYIKPENVVEEDFVSFYELKEKFPEVQVPAVWLPHGILGVSNSEIVEIPENTFGPFEGQLLVGDQGQSKIMRVFLEKVNGEYQGAAWDFRSGFRSGVLRLAWGNDGSLFVGETNRGWGSAGEANEGLQRLIWNRKLPFEMRAVRAMPDGFEIEFTKPVDKNSAEDIASYSVESFIYKYHPVYGSPPVNREIAPVKGVKLSDDRLKVRIIVDNLKPYFLHEINLNGVRAEDNSYSLVHPTAYYTLNQIPDGKKLSLDVVSTHNSTLEAKQMAAGKKSAEVKAESAARKNANAPKALISPDAPENTGKSTIKPDYEIVKPLLIKNTCNACHDIKNRQVGPAFNEIAKRNYSNTEIVELIHQPVPENWPGYATPMPPMPHVPAEEAFKIAEWINSLN